MEGWIKLHRKITEHWIFSNPHYFRAWVIMLFTVNYEPKKCLISGLLVECDRGQSVLSLESWVDLFGVSKKSGAWTFQKVRTFFDLLEQDGMITKENMIKTTRITICNYNTYQEVQQPSNNQVTTKQQPSNNQVTTTKERKEVKNDKKIDIPTFEMFKIYVLENEKNISEKTIELKYKSWVENGWKDGNNKPIVNWKSKILNTIGYLPKEVKQEKVIDKSNINDIWEQKRLAQLAQSTKE